MSTTATDLRIAQEAARKQGVIEHSRLQSMLIPGQNGNDLLREVMGRLKSVSPPRGASAHRRHVSENLDALELRFYAKKAHDFVDAWGDVDAVAAVRSARVFRFIGPVTVTKQRQIGGNFFYQVSDGLRTVSVGMRGGAKKGYSYPLLGATGFVQPSGRAAAHRARPRGPRNEGT